MKLIHTTIAALAATANSASAAFSSTVTLTYDPATTMSPVPLPAGLPLVLTGLGAPAITRRRHG